MKNKLLANITPGEILKQDFLKPIGLSEDRLATEIGVPVGRIRKIVNGECPIGRDMAVRLGQHFKTTAQFWLNLQSHYDSTREIPNALTARTLKASKAGKDVKGFGSKKELFADLGL